MDALLYALYRYKACLIHYIIYLLSYYCVDIIRTNHVVEYDACVTRARTSNLTKRMYDDDDP